MTSLSSDMDEINRFSVSLPESLLQALDRGIIEKGYASRSEFIRDLIREKMVEEKWEQGATSVVGVLTLIYDHHQGDLLNRMVEIQHNHHIHILCNTHVHVDHHNCIETIIIRGKAREIEKIAIEIGGLRGVNFARLTRAALL